MQGRGESEGSPQRLESRQGSEPVGGERRGGGCGGSLLSPRPSANRTWAEQGSAGAGRCAGRLERRAGGRAEKRRARGGQRVRETWFP